MNQDLWKLPRLTVLWKVCRFAWKSAEPLSHSPPTGPWKSFRRQVASTIPTAAWKTRIFASNRAQSAETPAFRHRSRHLGNPRFPQFLCAAAHKCQLEHCLCRFFGWLARGGVGDLQSLTRQHVRDFVSLLQHFRSTTIAVHASALRGFLGYLQLKGELEVDLAHAVERPRLYRQSQPPQILDPEAVECLIAAVDRSTALGKRDYGMLLLAARYGLRPSDIRALRFENILWRDQRIVLVQSKTQRPLELPLLADVDEALVDYIRWGRPASTAREIFVRHLAAELDASPHTIVSYRDTFRLFLRHIVASTRRHVSRLTLEDLSPPQRVSPMFPVQSVTLLPGRTTNRQ